MGGRRKFGDRKSDLTQPNQGQPAKVLPFDTAHRGLRTPIARPLKRPDKPVPPPSMTGRTMRVLTAFLQGIARVLRSQSRGTESSGKRRA